MRLNTLIKINRLLFAFSQEPKKVKNHLFNESNPFKEHALKSMFDRFYRLENAGDISWYRASLFVIALLPLMVEKSMPTINTTASASKSLCPLPNILKLQNEL